MSLFLWELYRSFKKTTNSWVSNQMCAPSLSNNVEKNYHELVVVRIESIQQTMKAYCLCSCGQSCWVRCENLLNSIPKVAVIVKEGLPTKSCWRNSGKLQSKRPKIIAADTRSEPDRFWEMAGLYLFERQAS